MAKGNEKKKGGVASFIAGAIGLAASAFAFKKIIDMYASHEEGSVISPDEYEGEMEEVKKEYIGLSNDSDEKPELFNREKIENSANADKLFNLFLDKVEEVAEIPDKTFKISDIEKLIPMEETEIDTRSNYNYTVMSMLGGQSARDYFIFKNTEGLRDIFTSECNKSNRDNQLWKNKYEDEEFIINPKYIKDLGEAGTYYLEEE